MSKTGEAALLQRVGSARNDYKGYGIFLWIGPRSDIQIEPYCQGIDKRPLSIPISTSIDFPLSFLNRKDRIKVYP